MTPSPATFNWLHAGYGRASQLAALIQGSPVFEERQPAGLACRLRFEGEGTKWLGFWSPVWGMNVCRG